MKKYESGRSMVEMLGVLAIIGVLSVGGIAGYTMAMRKYKANEIVNAVSQCAVLAQAYEATSTTGTATCTDFVVNSVSPTHTAANSHKVEMTVSDTNVCTTIAGMGGSVTCASGKASMTWS